MMLLLSRMHLLIYFALEQIRRYLDSAMQLLLYNYLCVLILKI